MNSRRLDFITGIETSVQPDAGTPDSPNDVITLSYIEANYSKGRRVVSTYASPQLIAANGLTAIAPGFLTGEQELEIFVAGNGAAVAITANPRVTAPGAAGKRLTIVGTSDANAVTISNGNGLALNGDMVLGNNNSITLISIDATTWQEEGRA